MTSFFSSFMSSFVMVYAKQQWAPLHAGRNPTLSTAIADEANAIRAIGNRHGEKLAAEATSKPATVGLADQNNQIVYSQNPT